MSPFKVSPSEYVTLCQENEVWWLLSPKHGKFLSLGINHVDPYFMTGPYNKERTLRVYGNDFLNDTGGIRYESAAFRKWMRRVKDDLALWNFNTFGYHTHVPATYIEPPFYYIAHIPTVNIAQYDQFPDVFSTKFEHVVKDIVQQICAVNKHKKNLIGYAFMDLPALEVGKSRSAPDADTLPSRESRIFAKLLQDKNDKHSRQSDSLHPCVLKYAGQKSDSPGKQVWIDLLRQRYTHPAMVAAVYGVPADSWDTIAGITDWSEPIDLEVARIDSKLMLEAIYDRYYSVHCQAVRAEDPHHLLFSDKLNGNLHIPEHLLPIISKYVDILFVEWFSHFEEQEAALMNIYLLTGKPIMIGDIAFTTVQPNQFFARGTLLASECDVASAYYRYLSKLLSLPFVIGWANCGYIEGWEGLSSPFDSYCSRQGGLKNPFESVHKEKVTAIRQANALASIWHSSRPNDENL